MVGAEERPDPVGFARRGQRQPVVPAHVLLAVDHQADIHGAPPSGRARPLCNPKLLPRVELPDRDPQHQHPEGEDGEDLQRDGDVPAEPGDARVERFFRRSG